MIILLKLNKFGGIVMEKDSVYYKRKISLIQRKLDYFERKRKELKLYNINKRIKCKKLEKRYKYKLDKYLDIYLFQLATEDASNESEELKQISKQIDNMRIKIKHLSDKREKTRWYKFKRKCIYKKLKRIYINKVSGFMKDYKKQQEEEHIRMIFDEVYKKLCIYEEMPELREKQELVL